MKLDLHGKSHHDVFREVDKFIWICMKRNLSEFHIITGNSERMKSIVIGIIDDYKLDYIIGDEFNRGYVKVFN